MTTPCWSLWRAQTTNTILDEIYLPIYIGGNFKHIIFKISDLSNFRGGNSPPMVFNSSSLRSENPISRELKLNLFNELVELVRKMWAILSGRIPEWLILAETNLWEYFEDVRIGDGGAPGGKSLGGRGSVDLEKMLRPKKTSNNWKERIQMTMNCNNKVFLPCLTGFQTLNLKDCSCWHNW